MDIAIIGSGIAGTMIARTLSKYNLSITVFDKENDVADGTTMANSAIVHSGYDPEPGSNKAKYNVAGNRLYKQICDEMDVDFKQIGSLTVATNDQELKVIEGLVERAKENDVPVQLLSAKEVIAMEPNLRKDIKAALYAPTAGIVSPYQLAVALMENAMDNGVSLALSHEVLNIEQISDGYKIITNKGDYESKVVINCAGVYADKIHNMVAKPTFSIRPRRGQYFVLDNTVSDFVHHVIFPCPSDKGKGVLFTPTVHGNVLIGPNAEFIDDKEGVQVTGDGLTYVKAHAGRVVENIPYHKVIRSFAGLRASSDRHDFIIEEAVDAKGFIDVAGIESPGLASAPAIALEVEKIVSSNLKLIEKKDYKKTRQATVEFSLLSNEEKQAYIKKDSRYGNIVCRCERITEGEIVDCIHRNAGGRTVKGIKKRVRPGMGRCQGGFCEPLVVEILARELGIDMVDVLYDADHSNVLVEETKIGEVE